MYCPIEITDKILLYCEVEDIKNWKGYERMHETTLLKKQYSNLIDAARNGNFRCVKHLVSIGADIQDDLALKCSACNGHLEVVKYLVSVGADIHTDDDWALRWSASNGHADVVKYLVSVGAHIHAQDDYALRYSARWGHLEVVKYLISLGAEIRVLDDFHMYRVNDYLDVEKYLESMRIFNTALVVV